MINTLFPPKREVEHDKKIFANSLLPGIGLDKQFIPQVDEMKKKIVAIAR